MKSFTIIHGRLGQNPELKEFQKDGETRHRVNLSVGVGRDFGDGTDWYSVTMFGPRAKVIDKYFKKGDQILVWGRMQSTVKDQKKYWNLLAEGFDFCESQSSGNKPNAVSDIPDSWEQAEEDNPF